MKADIDLVHTIDYVDPKYIVILAYHFSKHILVDFVFFTKLDP